MISPFTIQHIKKKLGKDEELKVSAFTHSGALPVTDHSSASDAQDIFPPPDRDELLYQNERTQIFRRHFGRVSADGVGSILCKRPLGPRAAVRLQHERRILDRLAGIPGMQQLASSATVPAGVIALEDRQMVSLADALQGPTQDSPLPPTPGLAQRLLGPGSDNRALITLALQLTDLIAALHRAGVVHKDLSLTNIVLGGADHTIDHHPERRPQLIDFDLATTFAEERPGFIQPQDIAGTLSYMSPEQTGRTGRPVDHRTDLYALGAILYELAVGHPPFADHYSDPLHQIHDILAQVPRAPALLEPRIAPGFSDIVLRLLEKEPDRRYQSAEGLKVDLLQLRERLAQGERSPFALACHDYPLRLLPPSQLVGREAEIALLRGAFESTLQGKSGGVMITGAPGAGKSALINELRPIVTARRGWFVAGKFDQYRQEVGIDGVAQALHGLMRLMLAEFENELRPLRERVLQELGPNAGLMAALLPELAQSFGLKPDANSSDPAQGSKRMIQGALGLMRAIASRQRPVVVAIDDLQWASAAALDFIDAVLTEDRLHGFLLVASYRDNEVDATHPLTAMLGRWERLQVAPAALHLDNLPQGEVTTLLAAMLRLPPPKAAELAQAVAARTHGNPFDTVELVNALRQDGALVLGDAGWEWDAITIRRYVGTGEVIDLLAARIARLPVAGRLLLESMACLGSDISLEVLAIASGLTMADMEAQLEAPLDDGLLVMDSSCNTLRFRHDRVQQAAYAGLDPELRMVLQLAIARRLAARKGFGSVAAEQYLAAVEGIDSAECRGVIGLLQTAVTQVRQASNYVLAERFVTAALALLKRLNIQESAKETPGIIGATSASDTALLQALEMQQHAILYCLGRLDESDTVYRAIESRSDPLSFIDATNLQLSSMVVRGRQREALDLGVTMLSRLGFAIPTDINAVMTQRLDALALDADWVERGTAKGEASDLHTIGQAKLIEKTLAPAMICDPTLYAWLSLESQRLWVERGCCAELMISVGAIPVLLISLRDDYRGAYAVAQRVLTAGEAQGYHVKTALLRSTFAAVLISFWFEPIEDCIEQAQSTREMLLQAGELQYVSYSYYDVLLMLDCAPTLDTTDAETEAGSAFAERTGNLHANVLFFICRRLIMALRGETAAPGSFTDSVFDETRYAEEISVNPMNMVMFHLYRGLAAAVFGDGVSLIAHINDAKPLMAVIPGFYVNVLAHLLRALALAEQIRSPAPSAREGLLADFDTSLDWLSARAVDAPMNFLHLVTWLSAERAWALGSFASSVTAFNTALDEVANRQRPWHQALMTERAGLCHLDYGLTRSGQMFLREARDLYDAWGASAKVTAMSRQYSFLDNEPGGASSPRGHALNRGHRSNHSSHVSHHSSHRSGTASISASSLDLMGILRASQALSSETNLAALSVSVENLLREMTGATDIVGAMHVEDIQEWRMTPKGQKETITVEEGNARGCFPLSIFNYVLRTREPLLIDDVLRDDRFDRDPYFAGLKCCSLLGIPIFSQGKLRLILLMENRLSHGAFTSDRLDAVMLIAGQLVISTDNALLYDSLERKVTERTQALEEANQRLASLSITDALTGLANRRRFDEVFAAEWQRAIRPQTSLALAMIDIDQFKVYNDHYGHQGGDECLRRVAAVLKDSVRGDADLVARYGGEEFVIVLPGAELEAIQVVAERARAAVEALREPHEKAGQGIVTISLGVAAQVPGADASPESLIELADAALYRAKKNGRNQVVGSRLSE